MQIAVVRKSGAVADLKIELLDRLAALQMHLNPVREKAEIIKRVKSVEFWQGVCFSKRSAPYGTATRALRAKFRPPRC